MRAAPAGGCARWTGELHPRVGRARPGAVVEDLCRRYDDVVVHDVDVAARDRLEPCLILGAGWSTAACSIDVAAACPPVNLAETPVTSSAIGAGTPPRSATATVPAAIARRAGSSIR